MKQKWWFPFTPFMLSYTLACAHATKWGFPPIELRVIYTLGTILVTVILLFIIQPWKPDEGRNK